MEILNDYGAVAYYGVTTFTTGIFRAWFSLGDLDTAIRLSAMLMAVVLGVLGWSAGSVAPPATREGGAGAPEISRYRLSGAAPRRRSPSAPPLPPRLPAPGGPAQRSGRCASRHSWSTRLPPAWRGTASCWRFGASALCVSVRGADRLRGAARPERR
jgi:hypothetical protein